jgi:short-subunit dehydrogenase
VTRDQSKRVLGPKSDRARAVSWVMPSIAIVGVGPGIGEAVARVFARNGFSLALIARNAQKLEALQSELRREGFGAQIFASDASDTNSLKAALEQVQASLGVPDVLVYNVMSNTAGKAPTSLEPEAVVDDFRANVLGALTAAQVVAPGMKARGSGTILFTGGGLALKPFKDYASLAIGKAGIRNLTFSLAQELQPAGIHVATVTVAGVVRPNSSFAPDTIAAHFWRLYSQPKGAWELEHLFEGER